MKWQDYMYQPTGHALSRAPVVDPDAWISLVDVFTKNYSTFLVSSGSPVENQHINGVGQMDGRGFTGSQDLVDFVHIPHFGLVHQAHQQIPCILQTDAAVAESAFFAAKQITEYLDLPA